MTAKKRSMNMVPLAALSLGSLALGVVVAQMLPPNLLGARAQESKSATAASAEMEGQLWTCGMHPHILEDEPGQCPICGMNLTLVRSGKSDSDLVRSDRLAVGESAGWTCPDHPSIVESEPGACPIDGQDLVPQVEPGSERTVLFYRNPMDPTITSPVPAKDSMGMDYVPIYSDEASAGSAGGLVEIDPAVVQNMNVRTATVQRRDLTRPIRTVGYLEYDQQRMVTVTTKYSGWIEKVNVNYVGESVRRGQPLFEIYSPDLVQTERELLSAIDFAREMDGAPEDARRRALSMVESARTRLGYWDITDEQIARLEETGEVFRTLEVSSPSGGLVMKRMAGLEGMAVQPGMELFHIADLSSLWLSVELYEDQVSAVREGTEAVVTLPYFPGETFRGRVRFLEPEFSDQTRTMRAQIEVPNRNRRLRKGMYGTVELQPVEVRDALAVPLQAILRTGQRNVVVTSLGEGRFLPRDVILGHEGQGFAEVTKGLAEGDEVVTSAQFLLDSESTLREAIEKMVAARRDDVGDPAPPEGGESETDAGNAAQVDHSGH